MKAKSLTVGLVSLSLACGWVGCSSKDEHAANALGASDASTPSLGAKPDRAADGGTSLSPDSGAAHVHTSEVDAAAASDAGRPAAPLDKDAGTKPPADPPAPGKTPPPTDQGSNAPCDVADVLKAHCVQCHGKTLREGAPYSLVSAADFQRDLGGFTVGTAAARRIADDARPMPPPPNARLSSADVATLTNWIAAGAPSAKPGCVVDDSAPVDTGPTDGGVVVIVTPMDAHVPDVDTGAPVALDAAVPTDAALDAGPVPVIDASADAALAMDAGEPASDAGPPAPPSTWPMFGFDITNSRNNSAEKALSTSNVARLRELWRFNGPSTTSAPAVVDGVAYLPGWDGKVYALRLEDGSSVWTTTLPHLIDSSPTVTADRVFVSDDHGSVHALDRASGAERWSHAVDSHPETHLWSSPIYIPSASLIVQGVASGEEQVAKTIYTFRGSVVGLDAESGAERWRVATTDPNLGPGIGVWGTATVDETRKWVFIGTGNNYAPPASGLSDSLLAIDYETGQLVWSKQFTSGDTYTIYGSQGPDFDIGSTANLFSIDGSDYVGIGVKSGNFYALDRDSGAVRWMAAISGGSPLGGVISASAYADGLIFAVSNSFAASRSTAVAIDARNGQIVWRFDMNNLTYGGVAHANGVVYIGSTAGTIYAFAGATGDMLWADQTPSQQPIAGSPTVAQGRLIVPWGYQWTLRQGTPGRGGMTVYGL
jgi:polyvinyl alcohol dehydrogenase (cytochrome)